jgi:hypothetical protein
MLLDDEFGSDSIQITVKLMMMGRISEHYAVDFILFLTR